MIKIVENKKMEDGSIQGDYDCNLQLNCKGKKSLHLICIDLYAFKSVVYKDLTICKSCLNYLISRINEAIIESCTEENNNGL